MGGTDKKHELPNKNGPAKKSEGKPKALPPTPPAEDDDVDDGDIATPKRDRYGDDDAPL